MLRFLVDAQLPPKLAQALTGEGYEAEHVQDVGLREAKDPAIWEYARQQSAVIVTKDEDFVDRFRRQSSGPVIVWLRIGNAANAALLEWFLPALPAVVARIESGDRLVEVR